MKMREVRIEKITLNVGCGTRGNIENAQTVLRNFSGGKVIVTKTKKRTTFNVPKNKAIGCKITLRRNTHAHLKRLFEAKENKLNTGNFDSTGNFSFGIKEYIDVPGMQYDPKLGAIGFDVCVTLERPGYSVKRKMLSSKIGKNHLVTKEDAIDFVKKRFNVTVE